MVTTTDNFTVSHEAPKDYEENLLSVEERKSTDEFLRAYRAYLAQTTGVEPQLHLVPLESTLPNEMNLGFLPDRRMRVRRPIKIRFIQGEDDQVIAEAVDFNEFGYGPSSAAALFDLQQAFVELFKTLREDRTRLGKDLLQVWERLQETVEWYEPQSIRV